MSLLDQFVRPSSSYALPQPEAEELNWYAMHTRARHEKVVTQQLEEKGFKTFLPLVNQVRNWSDRRQIISAPIFSCYIFIQLPAIGMNRLRIMQTAGVLGLVGTHDGASSIPGREIADIKTLISSESICTPYPFLNIGKRVRIRGGSLAGVEGILVSKNDDLSLVVSIELIQRSMSVRIDGYDVEAV